MSFFPVALRAAAYLVIDGPTMSFFPAALRAAAYAVIDSPGISTFLDSALRRRESRHRQPQTRVPPFLFYLPGTIRSSSATQNATRRGARKEGPHHPPPPRSTRTYNWAGSPGGRGSPGDSARGTMGSTAARLASRRAPSSCCSHGRATTATRAAQGAYNMYIMSLRYLLYFHFCSAGGTKRWV